jgi:renalase
MIDVAIIGAGITGLACAQMLTRAGQSCVLFDKGRGVGGRVATRRTETMQFDHGAQYVTARDPAFAVALEALADRRAVAFWDDGAGRRHIVGTPGMSALARALGAGLDIRQNAQVSRLTPTPGGWMLQIGDSELLAARVVVTVPAPQVAALLGVGHPLTGQLSEVRIAPCLTLMAGIRGPAPFVSRSAPDEPLAWIAQDSSKPGRPQGDALAWVAQASPAFSTLHLEADPATMVRLMLPLLCDRLGVGPDAVTQAAAHRWRYARVITALGQPFLRDASGELYLGGDWCIGPRVEAAWHSGTAIAADMLGAG